MRSSNFKTIDANKGVCAGIQHTVSGFQNVIRAQILEVFFLGCDIVKRFSCFVMRFLSCCADLPERKVVEEGTAAKFSMTISEVKYSGLLCGNTVLTC